MDNIVKSPVERLRIKAMLRDEGIEEGILRSLESWFYFEGGTLDDLLSILRAHDLNALLSKSQPSPASFEGN